jgi:hypothetical protein
LSFQDTEKIVPLLSYSEIGSPGDRLTQKRVRPIDARAHRPHRESPEPFHPFASMQIQFEGFSLANYVIIDDSPLVPATDRTM